MPRLFSTLSPSADHHELRRRNSLIPLASTGAAAALLLCAAELEARTADTSHSAASGQTEPKPR